jgi:pantoate--beta-alanine ligase
MLLPRQINTVFELQNRLNEVQNSSKSIGFVPTMGALHDGHIKLIQRAAAENDVVIVSIFVNPTQFNNQEDLLHYPRTLKKDLSLLEKNCKNYLVFSPEVSEIYPTNDNFQPIELGHLDQVMEGEFRPGHFQGVVHVVHNLFKIVRPTKAYFGQKDFQQLAIIRFVTKKYGFPIEIVACETLRESNGLAMSSRNTRLNENEKVNALIIWETLGFVRKNKTNFSPTELKEQAIQYFETGNLKLEYLEIVYTENLLEANDWHEPTVCCIAAYCGNVRLIDNLLL